MTHLVKAQENHDVASYHHYEALHAIAVHRGIEPAARSLGITASALGKRLKTFERETRLMLIHRHTSASEEALTTEGKELAHISSKVVQFMTEADTRVSNIVADLKNNRDGPLPRNSDAGRK